MAVPVQSYNPAEYTVIVDGVPSTGFMPDKKVSVEFNTDTTTMVIDTDGTPVFNHSNDRSCKITVTLAQTSPTNSQYSGLALANDLAEQFGTAGGAFSIAISDRFGTNVLMGAECKIQKRPNWEIAKETSAMEWVFLCGRAVANYSGTLFR